MLHIYIYVYIYIYIYIYDISRLRVKPSIKLSGFRMLSHSMKKKFYILTSQCINVFQTILIIKTDCFPPPLQPHPQQPYQIYFYNEDANWSLCCRNRIFRRVRKNCEKRLLVSVMSVRPSVYMEQIGFSLNSIFEQFSKKKVEKIQFSLQSDNNNRYCTWRPIYIFDRISLISS